MFCLNFTSYYILCQVTKKIKLWGRNYAKKLQENSFTDKDTLNEVIDTLSNMTGKKVSDEKRKKIIDKICDGKVPNNVDKMF